MCFVGYSKSPGISLGHKITKKEKESSGKPSKSSQVFPTPLRKSYPQFGETPPRYDNSNSILHWKLHMGRDDACFCPTAILPVLTQCLTLNRFLLHIGGINKWVNMILQRIFKSNENVMAGCECQRDSGWGGVLTLCEGCKS